MDMEKRATRSRNRAKQPAGDPARHPYPSASTIKETLGEYARKRDFSLTPEPAGASDRKRSARGRGKSAGLQFVVQKHAARRLHYDFRLELDGALKSWAVPKGPSLDPTVKRLAVHVEDHPIAYAGFEGRIPEGEYGAGEVIVWDHGRWHPLDADPSAAYRKGKLKFTLDGEKLHGGWTLVRTRLPASGGKEQWLLLKENDAEARTEDDYDLTLERPESVLAQSSTKTPRASRAKTSAPTEDKSAASGDRKQTKGAAGANADAAMLKGARAGKLPMRLSPQLATLVQEPPAGDWRYEVKFDGYRMLARVDGDDVRIFTRNGLDWSEKVKPLVVAVRNLGLDSAWLDGEVVVIDEQGLPDFQSLQNAFEEQRAGDLVYCLFDLPYFSGLDLRATPIEQRRALLRAVLERRSDDALRFSEDISAAGDAVLETACSLRLEGVIGKRAGSAYVSKRSADWIKLKCKRRQEFVIGGYSSPQGSRSSFGSLLLGVYEDGDSKKAGGGKRRLRYVGRVGAGFTDTSLKSLHSRMQELVSAAPPFADPPKGCEARGVTWVHPELLCEIEFGSWTREGKIRHATFRGLREDKPAQSAEREQAVQVPSQKPAHPESAESGPPKKRATSLTRARDGSTEVAGVRISHPDRVIDVTTGLTKLGLAEFYRSIASRLLPHLVNRPVAFLRIPDGIEGEHIFQRHAGTLSIPGIRLRGPDDELLMEVGNIEELLSAVQMGAIEFHTWNATGDALDNPDRLIFDLDPDPSLPWPRVLEGTQLVLALLDELGLRPFLKTSGGKGLHVVVPIAPERDWVFAKAFCKAVSSHLARQLPDRFSARMGPQNRVGKIFVDYLRNQKGGTTVSAYSVRARPGLGVSVPIARDELERLAGASVWTVQNLAERLKTRMHDPWEGYANDQSLTDEMAKRLGMK